MPPNGPTPGTVSLVLAITGHRDLHPGDVSSLESEIGKIFQELRHEYPHTPLLLLTGLAEGADRVAVRATIAAKKQGVRYIAVLPMPAHLYREDFATEASDAEFEELLNGAERVVELPLCSGSDSLENGLQGHARDKQYERLGSFLVQYSQILIAIWDGGRSVKPGGTSRVVAMKLREEPTSNRLAFSRMNTSGAGPVYVLSARRAGPGPDIAPALRREIRYPERSVPDDYAASYRLADRFNADIARAGGAFANDVKESRSRLFKGAEAIGLSAPMEWVAGVYSHADALAIGFSTASLRIWKAVFVLLALSGVALALLHVVGDARVFLGAYYACLGLAFALMLGEWKAARRGRHEDYRALAEALRVQFFWMAAGLPDMAAERYLRKQAGETVWIRDAISECGLYDAVLDRSSGTRDDLPLRLRLAHNWIAGQADYFAAKKRGHETKKTALAALGWAAAIVGLAAPLVGLIERYADWSHAVAALALWWAALTSSYVERRGFAQEARQYGRMADLFHDADEDLKDFEKTGNYPACEETIRELGCQALEENGDWLAMHRERKLSVRMAAG